MHNEVMAKLAGNKERVIRPGSVEFEQIGNGVGGQPSACQFVGGCIVTFEYVIQENLGSRKLSTLASKGGFSTEDDARAEGEIEAKRIATSFNKSVWVDVRRDSE